MLHVDYTTNAWWKLNETSGTSASDSSGNSRTGTVTGTASGSPAVLNNGFSFNGATKIQATGLMGNPRNVSVAAWAKLTTADTTGAEMISLGDHFVLRLDDSGATKAIFYNGSSYVTASVSQTFAGTGWHHFAAVFDDGHDTLKLYIDGALAATTTTTSSVSWSGLGTNTVIGRNGNGGTSIRLHRHTRRRARLQLRAFGDRGCPAVWPDRPLESERNERHDGKRFHRLRPRRNFDGNRQLVDRLRRHGRL